MPEQVDGEMAKLSTVANGTMAVPVGAGGFQMSSASMDGAFYQDGYTGGYKDGAWGMMSQTGMMSQADMMGQAGMMGQGGQGSGLYSEFERREAGGMYDGIALPCHFLEQYYSQVRIQLLVPALSISSPKLKSRFFLINRTISKASF